MATVELRTDAMATGGDAVGRDAEGRATFVEGALPGERVIAQLDQEKARFAKGRLVEVLEASPDRRTPPCPHVARGCGGCGWQHAEPDAQRRYRIEILTDALQRLGGVSAPDVRPGVDLPLIDFRTTMRAAVVDGRAGFHHSHSHDVLAVNSCLVAHPMLEDLFFEGRYPGCREVTFRVGARTGDRLVLASPNASQVDVPTDVVLVGTDELHAGRRAWHTEVVDGRTWRISATSFFQSRPDGAEAIIDAIHAGLDGESGRLVDLCCGVGLLGGSLLGRDPDRWQLLGVERHRPAVLDAQHNLADLPDVRIVRAPMAKWRASAADVVVADPARSGLAKDGVAAVAATGAGTVALVSCDPASLGRDTSLLTGAGYRFEHTTLVDLFPQTPHIEAVSIFKR